MISRVNTVMRALVLAAAALMGADADVAAQNSPNSDAPTHVLQLDTGGHMALIKDIAFTPDGKQLVSASDDKTIRVWDLETGKTVRTIRGEIAPGVPGAIYAVALSPDGRWLAAGGYMAVFNGDNHQEVGAIRLYDFRTGELVALLKGHDNVVYSLAFSPDGQHLISGSGDATAIIWDVERRTLKHRLRGHTRNIYAVGFTPDGERAVTGAFDHDLRLWRVADGEPIALMEGHRDKVRGLAVAPDGTIASGDRSGEIRLWDGRTGRFLRVLARHGTGVGNISFSPNGSKLLTGIGPGPGLVCYVYDVASGEALVRYTGHDNLVLATAISPDGRWAATGGGNNKEIHIWDLRTGERRTGPDGAPLTLGGQGQAVWAAGFSEDGTAISWGNTDDGSHGGLNAELEHALSLPSAADARLRPRAVNGDDSDRFRRARTSHGAWLLQHRKGGDYGWDAILDIRRGGEVVASIERGSIDGLDHRAYSFTPDGQTIISSGASGWLSAYDLEGNKLGDFIGHEGDVWAVAPSPDGRYLVSGSHDQTVRLWNLQTRELLVTLFHGKDGEWVMWTPEGFFNASENGARLVGWHINQGPDREARYVTADQVRDNFFRPDLVAEKIAGDPDGRVRAEAQRLDIDEILNSGPAPKVEILTPGDGWQADDNQVSVTVRITDQGGGIGKIKFTVNGRLKATTRGRLVLDERGTLTREFELASTENEISVTASNRRDFVTSEPVSLSVTVDDQTLKGVPDLYVLAIGVDDYFDSRLQLAYAVKDAETLARVLAEAANSEAGEAFYRDVIVKTLPNDQVTRENVAAAFEELGSQMDAEDVFVFFVAGHGKTLQGDYYFLPPDFRNIGRNPIQRHGFGPEDWETWMAQITAEKSLLIYDTCEAGAVAEGVQVASVRERGADQFAAYERLKARTGRMTLMAASDTDIALEGYRNQHGLLTYAILEALAFGDSNPDEQITVSELFDYVGDRVPELSCELTMPQPGSNQQCYRQLPQASFSGNPFPIIPRYVAAYPGDGAAEPRESQRPRTAPERPTHVIITPSDLLDQAERHVIATLSPGATVTVIRIEDNMALIARGDDMGLVPRRHIVELQ